MTDRRETLHSLRTTARAAELDDRLDVATSDGKTRTLTVIREPFEAERTYRADALLVECEGYGTEYTVEIPINKGERPQLLYPSGPATNLVVLSIDLQRAGEGGDADAKDIDTKDVAPDEIKSDTSVVDYLDGDLR